MANKTLRQLDALRTAATTARQTHGENSRDLLDDLDAVLGDQPVPAADVPALLVDLRGDAQPPTPPAPRLNRRGRPSPAPAIRKA